MATARRFHAEGARVGLVARDADRLASVAADLGGACLAVAADVSERAECVRAVGEVEAALGPIDVLVSNAGIQIVASLDELVRRMERGDFDLIAVGRALLGDPQWVRKVRAEEFHALEEFDPRSLGQLI